MPPKSTMVNDILGIASNTNKPGSSWVWKDWFEFSSFHGIVDITRPHHGKIWKLAWVIVIVAFSAMTIFSVKESIQQFVDNPTVQDYKIVGKTEFQLPDVIVCTHQRINVTKLKAMGASDQLISALVDFMGGGDLVSVFDSDSAQFDQEEIKNQYQTFLEKNGNPMFDEVMKNACIDCNQLFQYCSFSVDNSDCCTPGKMAPALTPRYGQCYRIKPSYVPNASFPEPLQSYPGSGAGVQMILKGHFPEFNQLKSSILRGALIDVVYPNAAMSYSYHQIPLGVAATVHLSLQRTTRIKYLQGRPFQTPRCLHQDLSNQSPNSIASLMNTANGCFWATWNCARSEVCGCSAIPGLEGNGTDGCILHRLCDPLYSCDMIHQQQVLTLSTKYHNELCLPQCDSSEYKVSISYSRFDSDLYKAILKKGNDSSSIGYFDENSIFLDIYHPTMDYVTITEVETNTPITLLSSIGGAVGLWLGASLMTFVQFGFYLTKWTSLHLCRRQH